MTKVQRDLIRTNLSAALRQAADQELEGISSEKMEALMELFNVKIHDNGTGISFDGLVPVRSGSALDPDTLGFMAVLRRLPSSYRAELYGEARGFLRCLEMQS